MLNDLLSEQQSAILKREREALQDLLALLSGWEAEPKDLTVLRQTLSHIDDLFLLVTVGEFNAGKSAFINALLGERTMPEGVTPTTSQIHILRHGEKNPARSFQDGLEVSTYPAPFLEHLNIVDTPGTNAVLREHEAIVRDFIPRSDLVLFITSADQPFTQSEREFLSAIREWGKKVILIINKTDILPSADDVATVVKFVSENAALLLGHIPEVFPISARRALEAKQAGSEIPEDFRLLESHLLEMLNESHRIQIKLGNPVGVGNKLIATYMETATERLGLLADDRQTLETLDRHLQVFRNDMDHEFERHFARVDNELLHIRTRGEEFFDEKLRIRRVLDLVNTQRMQEDYEQIVVGDAPEKVESHVQEMIDWMVQRELSQWRSMADQLGKRKRTEFLQDAAQGAASGFEYNRQALLDNLGKSATNIIASYDRKTEARRLVVSVQDSLAKMAVIEAGAIGLGVLLKVLLVSTAADVSGVLAAGVIGVLGFAILPYKKRQAKSELRNKIEELRGRLELALHEAFDKQLDNSVARLEDSVAPYSRFVRAEYTRMTEISNGLAEIKARLHGLDREIEALSKP